MEITDPRVLVGIAIVFLYVMGALFMRNTHPYRGSPDEPFESKQRRRAIGMFLIGAASLMVGIVVLIEFLIYRN